VVIGALVRQQHGEHPAAARAGQLEAAASQPTS
jgi:hypothetical protein